MSIERGMYCVHTSDCIDERMNNIDTSDCEAFPDMKTPLTVSRCAKVCGNTTEK